MLIKIHQGLSWLLVTFGAIHLYFATCLETFDTFTLWFIGSGMAIIFAGFINLIHAKSQLQTAAVLSIVTNTILLVLFCTALAVMRDLQVYIGIFLSGALLTTAIAKR